MSDLTPERLEKLRRVAEAATPEPWETTEFAGAEARSEGELGVFAPRHSGSYQKSDGTWHSIVICRGMDGPTKEANVEYIAAFDPPTVLALLAEIERLRREWDGLGRTLGTTTYRQMDEDSDCWECTADDCNEAWCLNGEGTPSANNMRYCHGCGRRIVAEEPWEVEDDE